MRLAFLVATLAVLAGRARADEVACDAPRAGIVACLAGKLCACRLERGGAMTGLPDGYRWDCGVLRPACADLPATLDSYPYPLPQSLSINKSETNVTTSQTNRNRAGSGAVSGGRDP